MIGIQIGHFRTISFGVRAPLAKIPAQIRVRMMLSEKSDYTRVVLAMLLTKRGNARACHSPEGTLVHCHGPVELAVEY